MLNKKNSSNLTKNSKILIGLTAFLAVLYILSFTKSCTSKDNREILKTSLVNQKYKNSISSFELEDSSGSLSIVNSGSFWTVSTGTGSQSLPASTDRIQNLLENLISIRNLYKISDKITEKSTFGLTNGTEFHLRYYTEDIFHELIFGNQDFSLSSRYMMTEKNTQVYETDTSLDIFLTTSIQNWAEPYIISQTILGKIAASDIQRAQVLDLTTNHLSSISDIQKLLDLRHGGMPDNIDSFFFQTEYPQNPETIITLELGNKNEIEVKIYKSKKENEYIVNVNYKIDSSSAFYTSTAKISSWTYNKIKEITL